MPRLSSLAIGLLLLFACPLGDDSGEACGHFIDNDGDGFGSELTEGCGVELDGDCDDTRDDVAPDGNEVCDGVDNDCDGEVDNDPVEGTSYWTDADGDGYGSGDAMVLCERPGGVVEQGGDCDDDDSSIHPDAVDLFNGIDDDCDGTADGDGTLCGTVVDPDRDPTCPQGQLMAPMVVVDTTEGAPSTHLGWEYLEEGCDIADDLSYSSGDLVYPFLVPANEECVVTLDDSCDPLVDVFIRRVSLNCALNQAVYFCYYLDSGSLVIPTAEFGQLFEIVVDASSGPGAIFELTVDC